MEIDKKLAKILVVDDNIDQTNTIYDLLTSLGYEASVAFSPKEAEFMIRRQPYNIILIDCLMPEVDGHTLAGRIYEQFGSSISVILMSGIFKETSMDSFRTPNLHSLIRKPIDEYKLDSQLINILKKMFYSKQDIDIYSLISQDVIPISNLQDQISQIKVIREGDILFLFSYLLRSKSEGVLHISDSTLSVEISFFNGKIIDFIETNQKSVINNYITKNKLLSGTDLSFLSKIENNSMAYLIEQGFISPHQYIKYTIERITSCLNHFVRKTKMKVQFKPLENDVLQDIDQMTYFDRRIHLAYLVDCFVSLVQTRLSETYLMTYLNQVKDKMFDFSQFREIKSELDKSMLKSILQQKNKLPVSCFLEDFYKIFKNDSSVQRAVFWALSQGFTKVKNNNIEVHLEKNYQERYSKLYENLKDMTVTQVFEYLGCVDVSDFQKLKSVYQNFIQFNHVDKFNNFGDKLCDLLKKINQIIIESYDTISNQSNMKQYKRKLMAVESSKFVELESLKESFKNTILMKNYGQALKIYKKMKDTVQNYPVMKLELSLWEAVLEIKQNDFKIDENRKIEISSLLSKPDQHIKSKALFHYVEGLIGVCKEDFNEAKKCFDKSLENDSTFILAKIELVGLKKLQNNLEKSLSGFMAKMGKDKKSS